VDDQKPRPDGDSVAEPEMRRVESEIYGLVICSSTLAAAASSGQATLVEGSVFITVIVYWLAESYSRALALHGHRGAPLNWSDIREILGQGWPMVSASFLPLVTMLVMGVLGAPELVAVNVSLAVAVVLLLVAGWTASRAAGLRGWRLVGSTAFSGGFGLAMVALKNVLH
jgi:hypothetical protein